MNRNKKLLIIAGAVALVLIVFSWTSYNSFVKKEEKVKFQWSEVQNAYQRRLDLIPNLVNTVKGIAEFEQSTIVKVTEARARAASVNVDSNNPNASDFKQQSAAQDSLASAVNKLLITIEKYPQLQSTVAFRGLQAQLEGTERRIKFARNDFNASINDYNSTVRSFPKNMVAGLFGFKVKEGFTAEAGADQSKEIKF